MDQSQRKNMSMVFVLVVSAIFCAAATFVAISLVVNRDRAASDEQTDLPEIIVVDDLQISLSTDPEKAVFLPGNSEPSPEPESVEAPEEISEAAPESSEGDQIEEIAPEQTQDPTPVQSPLIYMTYTVQPGDTLYSIANSHNSSIELMAINGIDSGDIVAGSTLELPIVNPAYCPGMKAYVVRANDTVFSLARTYNTTTEQIIQANNLNAAAMIYTSEVLCLP